MFSARFFEREKKNFHTSDAIFRRKFRPARTIQTISNRAETNETNQTNLQTRKTFFVINFL
jgi:hypothetical protein